MRASWTLSQRCVGEFYVAVARANQLLEGEGRVKKLLIIDDDQTLLPAWNTR
jgi:hypothetical protein